LSGRKEKQDWGGDRPGEFAESDSGQNSGRTHRGLLTYAGTSNSSLQDLGPVDLGNALALTVTGSLSLVRYFTYNGGIFRRVLSIPPIWVDITGAMTNHCFTAILLPTVDIQVNIHE
jgi:hypothetical protein